MQQYYTASQKVYWPRGQKALMVLKEGLEAAGFDVVDPIVYRMQSLSMQAIWQDSIEQHAVIDVVVLSSPSAVTVLLWAICVKQCIFVDIICQGPQTQQALQKALQEAGLLLQSSHIHLAVPHHALGVEQILCRLLAF